MKENITNHSSSKKEERIGLMLWFRIARIYNQSIRESNQHLKKWKLSTAQFDVLVQVGSHDRLSQQELANKLLVTKGNITQLLSKMEALGLIKREQEWKTKYLSLTKAGKEFFYEVVPKQENFQASQFSNLNYKEKKQLLNLLRKIQKP
ncbi:MarR family winged helix-turn-helix transcriptional regulator [Bacillus atrophaeus]|uniref:MarR family winged helix-turn-helix transcriptional regulator n=1 Tax=Bacillus atrophaeus TaxID=1452 RepID=UPI00228147DF|nr:MarR family transcriptional regulator [Bacillus atrophaeus]MCY8826644.1 MarR family transcriptional regulator [Bacillus atrophaeus]MCY8843184.1 MarR family transcriptional regulator [Bacillus atrophaeus]MEC0803825.1 MarR family transcriptional regulator [Bacillus atrophaeus]MEC0855539.1 MarR family transcriptional regulator [Bacillus atrophaeus]MEC0858709.1 MarR family transcriptional regulator [Bacillus atrophaeus]